MKRRFWSKLPNNEKIYLKCFEKDTASTESIVSKAPYDEKSCSVYCDRSIKRGLVISTAYGVISLALPRFELFIAKQY